MDFDVQRKTQEKSYFTPRVDAVSHSCAFVPVLVKYLPTLKHHPLLHDIIIQRFEDISLDFKNHSQSSGRRMSNGDPFHLFLVA